MARAWYGATPADFGVAEDSGNGDALIASGLTLDMYDAKSGNAETDLLDAGGSPVTQIVTVAGELVEFQGPDAYYDDLWGTPDAGTSWYRFPPSPELLIDRVDTLEAAGAATVSGASDVSTAGRDDGDVLSWDSGAGEHVYVPQSGGGGTSLPDGGTTGEVLAKDSATDGDADWNGYAVPTGGATGSSLVKTSGTDGATEWDGTILRYEQVADQAAWEASAQTAGILYYW